MNVSLNNLSILDPGTTLGEEDQRIIKLINRSSLSKSNIVLYSARVAPEKGLIEAFYAFRIIARKMPNLKLIVTSHLETSIERALRALARRLGIHDKVEFTGYLPREELFKLKARALVHLYPSHEDSVSYSVLESLALGTPVAAYDIPALRIDFLEKGAEGISLVEEFDVRGLAEEALKLIGQKASPPRFPSWNEIMEKELSMIKRLIDKG
ncbi:MAG: glycosyltransferase family 4 protein [Sulfolobales archaeon]